MSAEEKSNPVSSRHRALLIGIALVGFIGLSAVVILWPRTTCEGIFEQTAPSLEANLEIIKNKGAFAVRQERIQDLSEGAQKVGLHLKTCCTVLKAGKLDASQFQQCLDSASAYGRQIALVAQQVTEVADAMETGGKDIARAKIADIDRAIQTATSHAEDFARQVAQIKPQKLETTPPAGAVSLPQPPKEAGTNQTPRLPEGEETEPNDHISAANPIAVGATMGGRLATGKDRDFFTLTTSSQPTGKMRVILRKFFDAEVDVYDSVEREIESSSRSEDTPVSFSFKSAPNSTYYILVKSFIGGHGDYELVVREE